MNKIIQLLNELESKISYNNHLNESVSAVNVGWHIEHILLSTNRIINAVSASKPENYKWKFNKTRMFVFFINKIPRGKAKAPKAVQPNGEI